MTALGTQQPANAQRSTPPQPAAPLLNAQATAPTMQRPPPQSTGGPTLPNGQTVNSALQSLAALPEEARAKAIAGVRRGLFHVLFSTTFSWIADLFYDVYLEPSTWAPLRALPGVSPTTAEPGRRQHRQRRSPSPGWTAEHTTPRQLWSQPGRAQPPTSTEPGAQPERLQHARPRWTRCRPSATQHDPPEPTSTKPGSVPKPSQQSR